MKEAGPAARGYPYSLLGFMPCLSLPPLPRHQISTSSFLHPYIQGHHVQAYLPGA